MPRTSSRQSDKHAVTGQSCGDINEDIKAVRLEIERERLHSIKAKTAALPARLTGGRDLSLEERLDGYAPTQNELKHLRAKLAQRIAVLSLNQCSILEKMLAHRREHGCNDIELLELELNKHNRAQAQRIRDNKNAYGEQTP